MEEFCYITDNTYSKEEVVLVFCLLLVLLHVLALDFAGFLNCCFGNEGCKYGS